MKYLTVLFIFLFIFAGFTTYIIIADGDINAVLKNTTEIPTEKSEEIQVFQNFIFKENEYVPNTEYIKYTEETEKLDESEEKQIFISVCDTKTNNISTVDLEEYLCGVVFSEMPSSFEIEALKAQAVAARSFCVYKILYSTEANREEHHGADVCNDYRHCKDYISFEETLEKHGEDYITPLWKKVKTAVLETKGEIITYKSEPAIAVFHAISGEATESAENVWGNSVPYLVSVPSEEENNQSEIRNYITESIFEPEEFKNLLLSHNFNADFSNDISSWITDITLNSSGRVDYIKISEKKITGKQLREIFSLRSTYFTLEYSNQTFVFTVKGYGHGVGMSQYGANLMAKNGRSYTEILLWYYTGVEIRQAEEFLF